MGFDLNHCPPKEDLFHGSQMNAEERECNGMVGEGFCLAADDELAEQQDGSIDDNDNDGVRNSEGMEDIFMSLFGEGTDQMDVDGGDGEGSDGKNVAEYRVDYEQVEGPDGFEEMSFEGVDFESSDAAFGFFSRYAIENGFKARRGRVRWTRDVVTSVEFCCHRQGFKMNKKEKEEEALYRKPTLRCGCGASIWFKRNKDCRWVCARHVQKHNHPFLPVKMRHLLNTSKDMSDEQFGTIMSLLTSGIRIIDTFRVFNNEAGGPEISGMKKKNYYNKVAIERAKVVARGDAESLVQCFKDRAKSDLDFFYAAEVDDVGRLSNFFWRDGQMKADYMLFGDFVSVDTTYRTNRYNMFCVPFVGCNNHRQNIMFGCAFLVEQKARAFEWVLRTFLKSMDDIKPQTLFSDQDNAFLHAFDSVFKQTKHRLCLWHIAEKAPSKLRYLYCRPGFQSTFMKCLYDCLTEEELIKKWNEMVCNFGCSEDTWLKFLWRIRERWALCLSRDVFSGGTLATQRSESTNSVLTSLANKQMGLFEIFKAIEVRIKEWRHAELEKDYNNCGEYDVPIPNDLLIHASKVYSFRVFKDFEEQFNYAMGAKIQLTGTDDGMETYCVPLGRRDSREFIVTFHSMEKKVECSCKFFKQQGFLCAHAIRILHTKCEEKIPRQYILKRWTKNARTYAEEWATSIEGQERLQRFCWRMNTVRECTNLITYCMNDATARKRFDEAFLMFKYAVMQVDGDVVGSCSTTISTATQIHDPQFVTTNTFGRKRSKSEFEKGRVHRGRKRK